MIFLSHGGTYEKFSRTWICFAKFLSEFALMSPTWFLTKLQTTHEKVTKGPAQIQLVRELEFGIG